MNNEAVLRQLATALGRAKGNKTQAKRYLLEAAAADHALLLSLAEPFLDSIAGYALDLYTRRFPDAEAAIAAATPPQTLKPPVQTSEKQKAAMELLAASYKKKADKA